MAGTVAEVPEMVRERPWVQEAIDTAGRSVIDRLLAEGVEPPKQVTFFSDRTVTDPHE